MTCDERLQLPSGHRPERGRYESLHPLDVGDCEVRIVVRDLFSERGVRGADERFDVLRHREPRRVIENPRGPNRSWLRTCVRSRPSLPLRPGVPCLTHNVHERLSSDGRPGMALVCFLQAHIPPEWETTSPSL